MFLSYCIFVFGDVVAEFVFFNLCVHVIGDLTSVGYLITMFFSHFYNLGGDTLKKDLVFTSLSHLFGTESGLHLILVDAV